jgi:hypothetical protein
MLKFLKTLSLILASLILVIFLFTVGATYWILNNPQSAWNFASRYLLPEDLKISWEAMDFDWQKKSWTEWEFAWSTKNLVVLKSNPQINVGMIKAEADFGLNFWNDKPTLELNRLVLQAREKSFYQVSETKTSSPEQSIYQIVNNALSYLSQSNRYFIFNVVDLQIAEFQLRLSNQKKWDLSGTVLKNPSVDNSQVIQIKLSATSSDLTAEAKGELNGALLQSDQSFLKMEVSVIAAAWSYHGGLLGIFKDDVLQIQSQPKIELGDRKKPLVIIPQLQLSVSETALDVKAQTAVTGLPGPISNLQKVEASLRVPLQNDSLWSASPAILHMDIPVDLFLIDKNMRAQLERACRCKLTEEFHATVNGKAWLKKYFSENSSREKIAEANLKFKSVKNKLFSADLAANIEVSRKYKDWLFAPRLDADITIHNFQGIRRYLDAKGVIIPAPLDILEGTIDISAKSPVAQQEDKLLTTILVAINLKSPTQVMGADAKINLQLATNLKSLDVDVDAMIRTLKLDLPPLDPVLGIPAIASDSRILRVPHETVSPKFKVRVVSRLRTEKAGAIQLSSRFVKPNIPLSLLINSQGTESTGFVRFEPFTVNYLRRKIDVEKINISLAKNEEEDLPIDGRFRIEQGGYKILINLSGTVQSPSVLLTSDPVLSKSDIISVLIYGRVASELVANEAETAGNINAAVADRAVGLFGLWAFASTPIQSFSYNSTTKVYTATVDLGNGVTAGVGTNWEQATNFELHKRVSTGWMLTATWAPNQANRQEGRLVLQWEKRF